MKEEKIDEEPKKNLFGGLAAALKEKSETTNASGAFSFNFGADNTTKPSESSEAKSGFSFSFGNSGDGGGFGAIADESAKSGFSSNAGFNFNSAGKSMFNLKSAEDEGNEETENENDPHFEPIIPLPDLVEVKTGEEGLNVVFESRAKIYRWNDDQWKERGVGECKILADPASGKRRLILRRDQTLKLACNHFIAPIMKLSPTSGSDRSWNWAAMDNSDVINDGGVGEPELMKFAIKFKTPDIANNFKEEFEAVENKNMTPEEDKTSKPVEKPVEKTSGFSFGKPSSVEAPTVSSGAGASSNGFSFGKSSKPADETPDEMVRRLEREKMNADIAKATASNKFTFGVSSSTATTGPAVNNTGFGSSSTGFGSNTGFGGFGSTSTSTEAKPFQFGVSTPTTSGPVSGGYCYQNSVCNSLLRFFNADRFRNKK